MLQVLGGGTTGQAAPSHVGAWLVAMELSRQAALALASGESRAGFHPSDGSHRLSLHTWASLLGLSDSRFFKDSFLYFCSSKTTLITNFCISQGSLESQKL